ncbi:MAG: hypothetical protein JKY65_12980, partial [Planctomycetes bacterium]|nr:hypothetical protein [Planctomycetota bacterium]
MRRTTTAADPDAKAPGCGLTLLMGCGMVFVGLLVCGGFLGLLYHQSQAAEPAVDAFSARLASLDYAGAYATASPTLRKRQTEAEFTRFAEALNRVLGSVESRTLGSIGVHAGANSHKLITIHYRATFHEGEGTLIVTLDDESGELLVRGWQVKAEKVGSVVLGVGDDHDPKEGFLSASPAAPPSPA